MAVRREPEGADRKRRPPATTPEGRENQLIAKALDLVEKQIDEGTVSSQVLSILVKSSSPREKLERGKLIAENEMLKARVDSLAQGGRIEELYEGAIKAMRVYSGQEYEDGED